VLCFDWVERADAVGTAEWCHKLLNRCRMAFALWLPFVMTRPVLDISQTNEIENCSMLVL
jgi:hypothetical protein